MSTCRIAAGPNNNVYVAGQLSNNVFEVTPEGVITEIIDATGAGPGSPLSVPSDLAVDSLGNVFVTGRDSDNAFKITPLGTITKIISATGDGAGNPLSDPNAIAVDSLGNVYVAGYASHNVFKITSLATISVVIDSAGAGAGSPLSFPAGLAINADDNLFVVGEGSNNVLRLAPDSTITEILDAAGDGSGNSFNSNRGLAVGPDGAVYASGYRPELGRGDVFRVAPGGAVSLLASFQTGPSGLAVDSANRLFVGLSYLHRVVPVDFAGTVYGAVISYQGDGMGNTLLEAGRVAVDADDNVYATGVYSHNAFKASAPIPEPGVLSSFLSGIAFLIALSRRRNAFQTIANLRG